MEEQFTKSNLEIIKFILRKYPPLNYVVNPNRTIDEQWEFDRKNFVYQLCTKYALDNYEKNTDEEKLKYTIISEISTKVNSIYNEIK